MAGRSVGGCLPRLPTNDSRWKMRAVDLFSQSPCLPMFLPTESVFPAPLSVLLTFFFSISFPFLLLNRAIIYGPILFYTSISLSHTKDRLQLKLITAPPSDCKKMPSVCPPWISWFRRQARFLKHGFFQGVPCYFRGRCVSIQQVQDLVGNTTYDCFDHAW